MPKAMIISVGGSLNPIVKSITFEKHRPEFICFFASGDSANQLGTIKDEVAKSGHRYKQNVVITTDHDDLIASYQKALDCIDTVHREGYSPDDTLVDFTGGTKVMTAALALAALGKGYTFSYVAGMQRTKNGLGTVVTGTEQVKTGVGPWHLYAVQEKRALSLHINSYRFRSALAILENLLQRPEQIARKAFFEPLKNILEGYIHWEAFRHASALQALKKGHREILVMLRADPCPPLESFSKDVGHGIAFLEKLSTRTKNFKEITFETVLDLLSNAERRADEGKFDDAVARVYRALEMIGQIEFRKVFGAETGNVSPEVLPETIRDEYIRRYLNREKGVLKFGLKATYDALKAAGNTLGERFITDYYSKTEDNLKKLLSARNQSILAHGTTSADYTTYRKFADRVRDLFGVEETVTFPKLEGDW